MITPATLFAALSADAGLAALVGDRIYPTTGPQDVTTPHVIWQFIGQDPASTLDGPALNGFDLVQFSTFAPTYAAADAIRDALIAALDDVLLASGDRPSLQDRRDLIFEDAVRLYRADCQFLC